eukprot:2203119-Amphidinium_carterae.2
MKKGMAGSGSSFPLEGLSALHKNLSTFMYQDAVLCKLFANENKWAVLLKSEGQTASSVHSAQYILWEGQTQTHLQCLESASGLVLHETIMHNHAASERATGVLKLRLHR